MATPDKRFSRFKILIVDDDPLLTEFLREALNSHFTLILVAGGLEQAKQIYSGPFAFDAIVCDYALKDGTGSSLYDWLRKEKNDHIPFLMISGKIDALHQDDPAFEFLAKPFRPEDLLSRLEKFTFDPNHPEPYLGSL